ncbi:hypothetical protein Aperf_G00000120807 [Anoplocephala perfoliata]
MSIPCLKLKDFAIPCLGFGTYKLAVDDVPSALTAAIEAGYRHIDCAHLERTYLSHLRPDLVEGACRKSIERLKVSYLDLYLIHWPVAYKPGDDLLPLDENGKTIFDKGDIVATWEAMEELVKDGLVRHIGLSNFNESQIHRILDCATIKPVMLQIESNPHFPNQKLIDFARCHGILSTAFAPLGSPYRDLQDRPHKLLEEPIIVKIAKKHCKTPAQVIIRHGIQRGLCVIPKSRTPERIKENAQVFDFQLTCEEMAEIGTLGVYQRQIRADPMRGNPEFPFLDLL